MSSLDTCLKYLPDESVGAVVHVHPLGQEMLDWAVRHRATQVVLVTNDVELQSQLHRVAAVGSRVKVVDAVVSAAGGTGHWLSFNVSEVDGLLPPSGLRRIFPRLQLLDSVPVQTLDLPAVLASATDIGAEDRKHVLVLEAPGSELDLLKALPRDRLHLFDWILLRCAQDDAYEGGSAPAAVRAYLQERFYRVAFEDVETDPVWPTLLFCLDESAASRQLAAERIEELQRRMSESEQRRISESHTASQELATLGEIAEERLKQIALLTDARDAAVAVSKQLEADVQRLNESLKQLSLTVSEQHRKLEELVESRDAAGELAKHRLIESEEAFKARDAATQMARERIAQAEQMAKARDEQMKLAADRAEKLELLTRSAATSDRLAHERMGQIEQLTRARDEQTKLAIERRSRIAQLEAELIDLNARDSVLQEELLKAESHVELMGELLFRETLR